MNAGLAQGQANAYVTVGDMSEAQRLLQQSRGEMNAALGLNAQATGMYDTANKITAQLPAYAGQAAMAAYHAQVMYDPDAQPPAPALVLAQTHQKPAFLQVASKRAPEDELAKEMTHDLEMNFNKIAPFGKEDA